VIRYDPNVHSLLSMKDRVKRSADALSSEEDFYPPGAGLQSRYDEAVVKFRCDCEHVVQSTAIAQFSRLGLLEANQIRYNEGC